jgi:hypothetical protein
VAVTLYVPPTRFGNVATPVLSVDPYGPESPSETCTLGSGELRRTVKVFDWVGRGFNVRSNPSTEEAGEYDIEVGEYPSCHA